MKKFAILTLLASALFAADPKGGVVNFGSCISDSKFGKQEQANFETLRKQMTTLVEDVEKKVHEIEGKLSDKDYLDGLSPEGIEELNQKLSTSRDELSRYHNQYMQVLQQANYKMIQTLQNHINSASEKVAASKKLEFVGNKEAFFYHAPSLDVTGEVIKEMDKVFEIEAKKQAAIAAPVATPAAAPTEKK